MNEVNGAPFENPLITAVAGIARSGTSLVMQMLASAGMKCSGQYPAFEDVHTRARDAVFHRWLRDQGGTAVKLLENGTRFPAPPPSGLRYQVIIMRRDAGQQAKSTVKFVQAMTRGAAREPTQSEAIRMVASIAADHAKLTRMWLSLAGDKVLPLAFESLITSPLDSAKAIAQFVGLPPERAETMASVVVPRSVMCFDGLMEVELLKAYEEQLASMERAANEP